MRETDVVVGAGITGLVAALILSEIQGRRVLLVERESEPGGLLRCFNYGEYGVFDYGMHNMYETGIPELDALLFELLPEEQWQVLSGPQRDLAGVIFNEKVQYNTPFPDLRYLSKKQLDSCIADFFNQLESGQSFGDDNAWDVARSRFGAEIASIIDSALQKQFGMHSSKLSPFASLLTTLSRVVLFSENPFSELIDSIVIRDRLAWPEQRSLPDKWESGRKAYYPRQYGMYRVIDALMARLQGAGVEVLFNSQVSEIEAKQERVQGIVISSKDDERRLTQIGNLVWSSGMPPLAQLVGVDLGGYKYDSPRKTVVVNLLLNQPPQMKDLYYLYCYQPGCYTFRITNFTGYCVGAPRAGGWPVAVELLLDAPLPDEQAILNITLAELTRFKVIASEEDVIFSAVEILASGFPMPSVNNFSIMADIRNRIADKRLLNLTSLGVLSEENVFFQRDVLAQTWSRLVEKVSIDA
ncbi:NAD(P)-binding protein [Gammaproteobacteria bacterium]|nr:NAD(P)-binding protein [Gammaproteobacteria bacterium]